MEVKNGGKKMRNHKKAFSKKMLSVLLSIIVLTTLLYAGLVNANANEVAMPIASATGTVSLNSNEVNARNLSFDKMINEISSRTGKEIQQIVTEMIELKRGENVNKFTVEKSPASDNVILETLRANNYITVSVGGGQFPTFGGVYQPTELSVYGVGYTIGQDHTFMTEILNVVFNRNNCYASIPRTKQFSGNVYTNLELNDRIYYSVDGTFYNNGTTTVGGGTVIGANGFSVSFNVSGSSSYFADINHSGRWYG